MTPSFRSDGKGMAVVGKVSLLRSTTSLARSNSSQVATIGNMIFRGRPAAALRRA